MQLLPRNKQPPHTPAPGRFDHVGLNLEVVEQETRWLGVVGLDAAHLRSRQHHHRGLVLGKPALHSPSIEQVELDAGGGRWRCRPCRGNWASTSWISSRALQPELARTACRHPRPMNYQTRY